MKIKMYKVILKYLAKLKEQIIYTEISENHIIGFITYLVKHTGCLLQNGTRKFLHKFNYNVTAFSLIFFINVKVLNKYWGIGLE